MLTGKLYGDVTLPGHTGVVTHASVFMLAGNTTRWRQVVAHHYSGNSTNLKSALVRGQAFKIPEHVVNKENLPTNEVTVVPIKDLLAFQEDMALKIPPHLSAAAIEPSHFDKMKVGPALNVFSIRQQVLG